MRMQEIEVEVKVTLGPISAENNSLRGFAGMRRRKSRGSCNKMNSNHNSNIVMLKI